MDDVKDMLKALGIVAPPIRHHFKGLFTSRVLIPSEAEQHLLKQAAKCPGTPAASSLIAEAQDNRDWRIAEGERFLPHSVLG